MKKLVLFLSIISLSISIGCKKEAKEEAKKAPEVNDLLMQETTKGTGAIANDGDKVKIHYKGTFLDGKEFDSSYGRNTPFEFELGKKQVIEGMEIGVKGMAVGSKRTLVIPAKMAYGERGAGNVIPPNTPLKFEIELLEVAGATDTKTKKK